MRFIRFLLRLIGTCVIASGFVALVIDGTRSIADGVLRATPFEETLAGALPGAPEALEAWLRSLAPWLWDVAQAWVLAQPACFVLAGFGALLVLLGRRPRGHRLEPVEYA